MVLFKLCEYWGKQARPAYPGGFSDSEHLRTAQSAYPIGGDTMRRVPLI